LNFPVGTPAPVEIWGKAVGASYDAGNGNTIESGIANWVVNLVELGGNDFLVPADNRGKPVINLTVVDPGFPGDGYIAAPAAIGAGGNDIDQMGGYMDGGVGEYYMPEVDPGGGIVNGLVPLPGSTVSPGQDAQGFSLLGTVDFIWSGDVAEMELVTTLDAGHRVLDPANPPNFTVPPTGVTTNGVTTFGIPEPTSIMMLLSGMVGLALSWWRRR